VEDKDTKLVLASISFGLAVFMVFYLIEVATNNASSLALLLFLCIVGGGTVLFLMFTGNDLIEKTYGTNKVKDEENDQTTAISTKDATTPASEEKVEEATVTPASEEKEEETAPVVAEDDTAEKEENK